MFNFRITTKFLFWFLFVALLPLVIAIYVSYESSQKVLEEEVAKSLLAVADNKANQIEAYLGEREKNVSSVAHSSDMITAMEKYVREYALGGGESSLEYEAIDREYRPFLTYYKKSLGYEDIYFIDLNGHIVFSTKEIKDKRSLYEIALYEDSALAKIFIKTKDSLQPEVSDFEYSVDLKAPVVYLASPVSKGAELVGIAAFCMSNKGIVEKVRDYTGLGETGETIVASRIGDRAVILVPLRFDAHSEFIRKIPIGSNDQIGVQKAVSGDEGIGVYFDYRGKKVLGAWKYLPSFRLGLVVKMDTSEIFLSADKLRNRLLKIGAVLLLLVVVMAIFIARSISSPIKELTKVSATISGGDLTARAEVSAKDEIGDLAKSFNQMTHNLIEAKAHVEEKKSELEEQKRLLEKANKELDSFVYTASHDLRAPLRAISSFATFLEEDYSDKLDDEGKGNIKEIKDGASRMSKLIEDLLTLSRISRIRNPYEDTNINTLIMDILKQIDFDVKENNADVRIVEYLPTVKCDRIKMNALFLNLINNGMKFSSKNNKERPTVEIGYEDEPEFYKFYVKDNGIGIDPQYHSQIFGIFKRLHSAEEYDGTGAGLSIVKRVIDDHNGEIWVESEVGKGAKFCFRIPKVLGKEHKKIGEILVERGAISKANLEKALEKQEKEEKNG